MQDCNFMRTSVKVLTEKTFTITEFDKKLIPSIFDYIFILEFSFYYLEFSGQIHL